MLLIFVVAYCVLFSFSTVVAQPLLPKTSDTFKKVLECGQQATILSAEDDFGIANGELSVSIETYVQAADFGVWPPVESRQGKSRISFSYEYTPDSPSQDMLQSGLEFSEVLCTNTASGQDYIPDLQYQFNLMMNDSYYEQQYQIDQIVNQEVVASVAVTVDGEVIACCNLTPEFPDLPDEFSVTIEANMMDKGYSLVQREYYSKIRNVYRADTYTAYGNQVIIQDFNNKVQNTLVLANITSPNGLCSEKDLPEEALQSTQYLLFLDDHIRQHARFVPSPGSPHIVRGVPCEQWRYTLGGNGSASEQFNGTYDVGIYFAYQSWNIARSHKHRQLMRINVNGYSFSSSRTINHVYEYVDFIPSVPEDIQFNPCKIIPNGDGCVCGLADQQGLPPESVIPPTERTTVDGAQCLFPFIYNGAIQLDCVMLGKIAVCPDQNRMWQECVFQESEHINQTELVHSTQPSTDIDSNSSLIEGLSNLNSENFNSQENEPEIEESSSLLSPDAVAVDTQRNYLRSQQSEGDTSDNSIVSGSCSKGFTSKQAGNYVISGIIGLLVGAGIGGVGVYAWILKKRKKSPTYKLYDIQEMEMSNSGGSGK